VNGDGNGGASASGSALPDESFHIKHSESGTSHRPANSLQTPRAGCHALEPLRGLSARVTISYFDVGTRICHVAGVLGMANSGRPHTAKSQFYVTFAPSPSFDNHYVAFGQPRSAAQIRTPSRDPHNTLTALIPHIHAIIPLQASWSTARSCFGTSRSSTRPTAGRAQASSSPTRARRRPARARTYTRMRMPQRSSCRRCTGRGSSGRRSRSARRQRNARSEWPTPEPEHHMIVQWQTPGRSHGSCVT